LVLLGECYDNGKGVAQDHNTAIDWYKKSASQDNRNALCKLGRIYIESNGVDVDYEQGLKYLKAVARQLAEAQFLVAQCYDKGQGVQQNHKEAIK
jgi:TPR repeat protein